MVVSGSLAVDRVVTSPVGISRLVVERCLVDRSRLEEGFALEQAASRGVDVVQASMRGLGRLDIAENTLCVGSVPFIRAALQRVGSGLPVHRPYPESLRAFLQREVGFDRRLRDLLASRGSPIFVKPAEGWKRFTGIVLEHSGSARELGISVNQSVWWSEPVTWLSEWRAYCVNGELLDLQRVPNTDPRGPAVDQSVVAEAAQALYQADGAAGVVLDFGVVASGQTALIEANDGFSFGAYGGVTGDTMWKVWSARWPELVANSRRGAAR